jgi:flagellar hook assembly protein FlgD
LLSNPRQQRLVVSIYDVTGRHVQTLLDAVSPPGRGWLTWNGLDTKGRKVGSGVYFCRLTAGTEKKVSRVVYVRGK